MKEEDAREAYLDELDGIVDTAFLAPFMAEVVTYSLGPFSARILTTSQLGSTRTAERIAEDQYDLIGIHYTGSGYASGNADGRQVESTPGTVLFLDYGRPFSIADVEPRTVVSITIPRSAFPVCQQPNGDWHGVVLTDNVAGLLAGFMKELSDQLPNLPIKSGLPLADAFIDLLTAAMATGRTTI